MPRRRSGRRARESGAWRARRRRQWRGRARRATRKWRALREAAAAKARAIEAEEAQYRIREESEGFRSKIASLQQEVLKERAKASNCMREARLEIERQNDKALEMESEISNLKETLERRSNQDSVARENHDASMLRVRALEVQLEQARAALSEERASASGDRKKLEDCETKLGEAKRAADLLKMQSREAMRKCEDCVHENTRLKDDLNAVRDHNRQKLRQTNTKLQECKAMLDTLHQERNEAASASFKTKADLQDAKARLRKAELAAKTSAEKTKKAESELGKIREENQDLESRINASRTELEKGTKTSLEQVVELQSELIATTRSVLSLKNEGERKEERAAAMAADLGAKTAEASRLAKEVETLKRQKTEMRSQIAFMRTKLAAVKDESAPATPDPGGSASDGGRVALRESTNPAQKGKYAQLAEALFKDQEDFERMVSRLKRNSKKFKLRLGPRIKEAEAGLGGRGGDNGACERKRVLAQLIHTTITELDKAPEPLASDCHTISISTGSDAAPKTPEMYFQEKYEGKFLVLK